MKILPLLLILAVPLTSFAVTPPDTPTNFRTLEETNEYVSFSWDEMPGSVGYRVYRNTRPLLSVVGTSIADGNVRDGDVFGYTVSSYNDVGESDQTEILLVYIPDGTVPQIGDVFPRPGSLVTSGVRYLSFTTNESATCSFLDLERSFSTTGSKTHIADISEFGIGELVADFSCIDTKGNTGNYDYTITIVEADGTMIAPLQLQSIQRTLNELVVAVETLAQLIEMHTSGM